MAVAYDQIASFVAKDINHFKASSMATRAYNELGAALTGYLRANLRCAEDANDLAQEVYLRITRHQDVGQILSLKSFVFTIAKNLLRDKSRRCVTKLAAACVHEDDVRLIASNGDPLQEIEAEDVSKQIAAALLDLSPACQEAYRLSRVEELSYSEIAAQLGVSVSMIEKHISAALQAIRKACELH